MRIFTRFRAGGALVVLATALTGCFALEHQITLKSDLSGTMHQSVTLDTKPMVYLVATMTKSFVGETGPITDEDIETARNDAQLDERETIHVGPLPDGVTLISTETSEEGYLVRHEARFAFTHLSRLSQLDFSAGEATEEPQSPFEGLKIVDDGDTLLIITAPVNPLTAQDPAWVEPFEDSPELEKILTSALAGMRVAIVLEAPFEVVEHNATRHKGNRLYWEFGAATLLEKPETLPTQLRVRYRK